MKKLLITAAIITATLAVGCSTPTDTTNAAPETGNVGGNVPNTESVDSEQEELATWWLTNEDKWYEMTDRFAAVDLEGAVDVMNSMDPIPNASLNNLFIRYQAEINEALIRLNAGDIAGATANIKAGTAIMRDITAEIGSL